MYGTYARTPFPPPETDVCFSDLWPPSRPFIPVFACSVWPVSGACSFIAREWQKGRIMYGVLHIALYSRSLLPNTICIYYIHYIICMYLMNCSFSSFFFRQIICYFYYCHCYCCNYNVQLSSDPARENAPWKMKKKTIRSQCKNETG